MAAVDLTAPVLSTDRSWVFLFLPYVEVMYPEKTKGLKLPGEG